MKENRHATVTNRRRMARRSISSPASITSSVPLMILRHIASRKCSQRMTQPMHAGGQALERDPTILILTVIIQVHIPDKALRPPLHRGNERAWLIRAIYHFLKRMVDNGCQGERYCIYCRLCVRVTRKAADSSDSDKGQMVMSRSLLTS